MKINEIDKESETLKPGFETSNFNLNTDSDKISLKKKNENNIIYCKKRYLIIFTCIFLFFISLYFFYKNKQGINQNKTFRKINILLVGAPSHFNIGDNAILLAETQFLNENFPGINIKILFETDNYDNIGDLIDDSTLIIFHGGGNIGDQYKRPEKIRRKIITNYPNNSMIIFPQTIYFLNTSNETVAQKIYNGHKKLKIFAREEVSFQIMKTIFTNNKIMLTPDIVTYYDNILKNKINKKRNGILLLLRNDVEQILSKTNRQNIISICRKYIDNVIISDMVPKNTKGLNYTSLESKIKQVSQKISEISKSKLVITDRLHGMIFSAISETSCIVFGNYNHKIKSSAEWFSHLDYIKFLDDINDLENQINNLLHKQTKNFYDKVHYSKYYELIYDQINESLKINN